MSLWMNRKVGTELEFSTRNRAGSSLSVDQVARALRAAGLTVVAANTYRRSAESVHQWDVKIDGSCGNEVVTPPVTLDAFGHNDELRRGINAVAALEPVVTTACGLHVTIDCSDFSWNDLQNLVVLWARYESFFFGMLPASRRDNHFCQPLRAAYFGQHESSLYPIVRNLIAARSSTQFSRVGQQASKYWSMNISKFWRSGLVEFRLHSGSVNYEKIRRWMMTLLSLVAAAKRGNVGKRISSLTQEGFNTFYVSRVLGVVGAPDHVEAEDMTARADL